jgi:hypothetical protein
MLDGTGRHDGGRVRAVSPETEQDLRRDFTRSRRFGLVGVAVVAAATAAVALLFGQGNANPTGVYIVIFVLIFGFVGGLLYLQRRDLDTAETRSKAAAAAEAAGEVTEVTDPTTANSRSLLAALAIGPIDDAAVEDASAYAWQLGRSSISSGGILMVLIACAVIPWQLFQTYWTLYLFVPMIVAYAGFLISTMVGAGGSLAPMYASSEPTMKPLGLTLTEAPRLETYARAVGPGMQKEITGAAAYEGERHDRAVMLRLAAATTTTIAGSYPSFTIKSREGKLNAATGGPASVAAVISPLGTSELWKGVTVKGGEKGIVVTRKNNRASWMCDLWLAERLADAVSSA